MSHMRIQTKFLLLAAVSVVALAAYAFTYTGSYGKLCERMGGKWASTRSSCITPLCYNFNTCGRWANPAKGCHRLKLNDPLSDIYFQLGEPDQIKGNLYRWQGLAEKGSPVEAVIENEKLASLKCAT